MEFAEYIRFFFFFGLMLLAGGAFIAISHLCQIRLKNEAYDWSKPYECGIQAYDYVPDRYPVHYYFVGIIFVVFDVEAVFLIPWAVSSGAFRDSGQMMYWLGAMLPFFLLLVIGWVYDVYSGVLKWGHQEEQQ